MTLAVVKQSEGDLAAWISTEAGFIEGLWRYDEEPIILEAYQRAFMENRSRFRWITKGRQIGYSFVFALEALARCHLRDGYTGVFVSYNLEERKNPNRQAGVRRAAFGIPEETHRRFQNRARLRIQLFEQTGIANHLGTVEATKREKRRCASR